MSRDYYSGNVLWKNEYNIIYIYLKVYLFGDYLRHIICQFSTNIYV
jgi:hypothetical protein